MSVYSKHRVFRDVLATIMKPIEGKGMDISDLTQFEKLLEKIVKIINSIIANAPPLDKDIYVYRGVGSIDYIKPGEIVNSKGFLSTSSNIAVALNFANRSAEKLKKKEGTLFNILLPKGTRCLFMPMATTFSNESEILLSDNINLFIDNCERQIPVANLWIAPDYREDDDIDDIDCTMGHVRVCNAVVIPEEWEDILNLAMDG